MELSSEGTLVRLTPGGDAGAAQRPMVKLTDPFAYSLVMSHLPNIEMLPLVLESGLTS